MEPFFRFFIKFQGHFLGITCIYGNIMSMMDDHFILHYSHQDCELALFQQNILHLAVNTQSILHSFRLSIHGKNSPVFQPALDCGRHFYDLWSLQGDPYVSVPPGHSFHTGFVPANPTRHRRDLDKPSVGSRESALAVFSCTNHL